MVALRALPALLAGLCVFVASTAWAQSPSKNPAVPTRHHSAGGAALKAPEHKRPLPALAAAEQALKNATTHQAAAEAFQRAEAQRMGALTPESALMLDQASQLAAKGSMQMAEAILAQALALQDCTVLRRERAQLRMALNDPMGAREDLRQALAKDPDDVLSWLLLSQLETQLHEGTAAMGALQEMQRRAPAMELDKDVLKKFKAENIGQPL
ncbi:hypothetical protein E3E12_03205 [Formicincola oecophyllae]|uniref:Tetratricopeptide repeat protein n=1 Tax=Formicincola oecophyllae TaxID=2558361 RepID=A0A4Y6U7R4_9PROT|nr:tetratricopeptide repeat protein [Formicincola oecophyllae]QDH13372.2 hypothetical protein E3E12_03205 [Formicincola oecophyllae]